LCPIQLILVSSLQNIMYIMQTSLSTLESIVTELESYELRVVHIHVERIRSVSSQQEGSTTNRKANHRVLPLLISRVANTCYII
jgi:hypothetical protein